jgi:histone H3/H4
MTMLPQASIERIARKAGAKRISSDAVKELEKCVEEIGLELALEAAQAARHAKRKTILKHDIKLVAGKA